MPAAKPKVRAVTLVEPMPDGSPFALFVPPTPAPHAVQRLSKLPSPRDAGRRLFDDRGICERKVPVGVLLDAGGSAVFVNTSMQALARRADPLSLDRSGRPRLTNLAVRRCRRSVG